jgi:hypothetical protein
MDSPLFMADQDMLDVRVKQFIIEIDNRAARKTENGIDAFFMQAFDDGLRTSNFTHRVILYVIGPDRPAAGLDVTLCLEIRMILWGRAGFWAEFIRA